DNIAKRQLLLKQYAQAEASYQKALTIHLNNKGVDAETIRKLSASIYHNLGIVAQDQRQWEPAEQHYQQTLQISNTSHVRYANTAKHHHLRILDQEQQQSYQAEQYFQHALQIDNEYTDRNANARTYHHLGRVAQDQRQWGQAEQY